jgi:hypothetical protein
VGWDGGNRGKTVWKDSSFCLSFAPPPLFPFTVSG